MVESKGKRKLIITIVALVALIAIICVIAIINSAANDKKDPYTQTTSNESTNEENTDPSDEAVDVPETKEDAPSTSKTTESSSSLDPETVSTINIDPMSLTVSYVKGIGGFEYGVMRTPKGTSYVEFYSAELAGTKCTNDQGAFISIIEDPASDEASTLSQKTVVDGVTYGLSLAASSCTSNPDLLSKYQKSFSDAFSRLKKI